MTACPSCGAAVRAGAARCPLCGTDVAAAPALDSLVLDAPDRPVPSGGLVCPSCSHANPPSARFCNECGAVLAVEARTPVRPVSPPVTEAAAPPDAAARRALLFVGGGVAIVVALFAINALSARAPATPAAAPAGPGAGPAAGGPAAAAAAVPDGPAPPLPDSLQRAADQLAAENTPQGWFESGRFYLTAGFDAQESGNAQGVLWIRRAITDFEKSLAIEENADVRYALAEAAQFDPADPMRTTLEAQKVLQDDPRHPGGNYLLGVRRLQIGRVDSARVSFQRVLDVAPQDDPFRPLATQRLAEIAQTLGAAGAPTRGAPDGAGAPPPAGVPSALPPALPPAQ